MENNNIEPKFKEHDHVIISGSYTGLGDLKAIIRDVSYEKMSKQYFYNVSTDEGGFYLAEKFVMKFEK